MTCYDPYANNGSYGMRSTRPAPLNTAWMVTVADLFSLILTFFVLLYSMSVIEPKQWDEVSQAMMQKVNVHIDETTSVVEDEVWHIPAQELAYARGLDYLQRVMSDRFASGGANNAGSVMVTRDHGHIIVSLGSAGMFRSGSATIEPQAMPALQQLAQFLANIGNAVTVEGHTDQHPIHTAAYPSNWELSMARAIAVADILREAGYPHRVDIYGKAGAHSHESEASSNAKPALHANRVDIIIRETVAKK